MSEMTPELLKEIRERANAATKGPWTDEEKRGRDTIWLDVEDVNGHEVLSSEPLYIGILGTEEHLQAKANIAFAAHARTDVPALCDAIEAAWAERDALRLKLNPPVHICGQMGFHPGMGDRCPACEVLFKR